MNKENVDFPQYRMLSNGKVFYKIISMDEFIEIQFLGDKKIQFTIKAVQYPEKLKILDMLAFLEPYVEMSELNKQVFEE